MVYFDYLTVIWLCYISKLALFQRRQRRNIEILYLELHVWKFTSGRRSVVFSVHSVHNFTPHFL